MYKFILALFFVLATSLGHAQQATISIEQQPEIDQLLAVYKKSLNKNDYYRIQVGFGNSEKAKELKANVDIDFPDLPSQIDFDSPTYRVRIGRFKTKLEAERKFNEVRKKYPDAMLLQPKK